MPDEDVDGWELVVVVVVVSIFHTLLPFHFFRFSLQQMHAWRSRKWAESTETRDALLKLTL